MPQQETKDKRSLPMYFTSLKIKNVKSFGENEQILSLLNNDGSIAQWTLILGDNGVGKTTLLKCLAWMVPVPAPPKHEYTEQLRIAKLLHDHKYEIEKISKITGISKEEILNPSELSVKIKPAMDDLSYDVEVYNKILRKGENIKTQLFASFSNGYQLNQIPAEVLSISMDFERISGKLEVVEPGSSEILEFNTPNLFAYGASRHLVHKNFEKRELTDPTFNLLSDFGELYDPEQVLAYLDYAAIKEELENKKVKNPKDKKFSSKKLLDTLKKLLADLLPDVKNAKSIIINPPINKDGLKNEKIVEIQTDHGLISLFNISLGYQTMLSWAVDLAIRMLWLNPDSLNPLHEPAVVIIDEIDLHLHPVWQRSLKSFLISHFPKTQFICTAHSPFMAQSAELENLCVVSRRGAEIVIENDPYVVKGWRIGQIATSELFGLQSERSFEIEKDLNDRRDILDKDVQSQSDKSRLSELNNELSSIPVIENEEDQKIIDQIRNAAKLLKEKGMINDSDN
ncbi:MULTISPECIES: AAA family ATPase [unclassified Flavobacterium]|uniref:AAA family ATPase n=1 Tax=unclassified Flavobacterium TaxID=196869 RepID=UPI0006ABAA68|nr:MULTISPECIES: AAA family ATPase [unclassified Flavobacterium]KOP38918.1 hypothetical protein AKO67_07830 [Flavobacterium sp. VMW]OWU92869.1 hypothetical protein APR43_02090 [Flavobacterium sp. NLM]